MGYLGWGRESRKIWERDQEISSLKVPLVDLFFKKESKWKDVSGVVHTRVEVHQMDSEMSGLVEQPWLQLICCAICLPHDRNFRCWEEVQDGSECWLVCHCWTLEIEFNKRLSSLIIRLVNCSITTSLIYKLVV